MDVSFTKTVDLRVFCANFGVERGTVWNFAKVTSVKNAVFAVFQFLVVFAEFTFTFEPIYSGRPKRDRHSVKRDNEEIIYFIGQL